MAQTLHFILVELTAVVTSRSMTKNVQHTKFTETLLKDTFKLMAEKVRALGSGLYIEESWHWLQTCSENLLYALPFDLFSL